ncbi:MAG: alginate export family protein [Lentimicrobium sp.]|nr:alginate export family protein [Lentimicrobium sp.]
MNQLLLKLSLIHCFLLLFLTNGIAQFSIDAQLRTRFEMRDGYQKLAVEGANPTFLVSQRTRLSFTYETKLLKIKITPQDVRVWGDQSVMSLGVGNNPSLGLLEAFAELSLGNYGSVSAGRQQLIYDNRRLLGDRNWNQNSIAYDALVFKFLFNGWKLHAGATWNNMKEANSENYYPSIRIKSLDYLWLGRKFNDNLTLSFLHVSAGITETDTTNPLNFRHTSGIYGEYKNKNLSAYGNAYYQYGKNQQGNKISAFLVDADAGYRIGKFMPGLGLSYLSGNSRDIDSTGTDKLFDPLYGNRHRFFGAMDYFRIFAPQTQKGGLADYYVWLDYKFTKKVSIRNTSHYFTLAQVNPSTPAEKELGFENDLILKFRFSEWGELESGYCFFVPTASLKTLQNVPNDKFSQFFYLQLTLTPNLFKQTPAPEK